MQRFNVRKFLMSLYPADMVMTLKQTNYFTKKAEELYRFIDELNINEQAFLAEHEDRMIGILDEKEYKAPADAERIALYTDLNEVDEAMLGRRNLISIPIYLPWNTLNTAIFVNGEPDLEEGRSQFALFRDDLVLAYFADKRAEKVFAYWEKEEIPIPSGVSEHVGSFLGPQRR